jgi:hypothetical protein
MTSRQVAVAALVSALGWGPAAAGFFELAVESAAFDVRGGAHIGADEQARLLLGGRYTSSDDEDARLGSVLVAVMGKPQASEAFRFTLGAQVYAYGEAGDADVGGVGLGGDVTWTPKLHGLFFGARVSYAPGSFCWSDTDSILDWGARAGYAINPRVRVYLDYAQVDADLGQAGDVDLDHSLKFGFGFEF